MRFVRDKYIASFHKLWQKLEAEGKEIGPEVRVEINRPSTHDLYRQYVMDFLERRPDGTIGTVELACDPIETTVVGLDIAGPVSWNAITFACDSSTFNEDDLVGWGNRWIHDESPALGPQDGLTGVIHSASSPEPVGDNIEFSVDFGSAPFEAFEELLAILGDSALSIRTDLVDGDA
jgi:hypothetical protein